MSNPSTNPDSGNIVPSGWSGSTTLNSVVHTYTDLASRIKMQFGWPSVDVELCDSVIYDNINQALEWYSRYAGYTEEYLIFDSAEYVPGMGINMKDVFSQLGRAYNTETSEVSGRVYDYDLEDERRVISIHGFDPVEYSGTDYLFTLDYMFAQQTAFSHMMGNFGFDLITWHVLKDWLELRKKLFATDPQVLFDKRTQMMRLIPEPTKAGNRYVGVIGAWVERPISDMIAERWVYQYTLALSSIQLGNIRGKFGQVNLLGGGSVQWNDILSQGIKMKDQLEQELMDKFGESQPLGIFIG